MKEKIDKVHFHDCAADSKVLSEQLRVASYVMGACKKPNLVNDFLGTGSGGLMGGAYALAYGSTIVTQEIHRSMNEKSRSLTCATTLASTILMFSNSFVLKRRGLSTRGTAPKPV